MTNYSTLKSTGAPGFPPGFIIPWGHNSIPTGFLLCNGDPVSRTTYADLFAAIGITYGAGDGTADSGTTFNLPSLDGRQLLFQASGTNDGNGNVGGTAGSATIAPDTHVVLDDQQTIANNIALTGNIGDTTLNINQIPSHTHKMFTDSVGASSSGSQTNLFINANEQATKGGGQDGQGPTDFKYTIIGANAAANIGKTGTAGNSGSHNHNYNIAVDASNTNIGGTLSLNYNPITPLFSSTRLRAVIKT